MTGLEVLLNHDLVMPLLVFAIAFAYSSVGLGGGSSYTALMAIAGMGAVVIPLLSLMLNTLVTSAGVFNFWRRGHGQPRVIFPLLAVSFPLAWLGGTVVLPDTVFYWLLLLCLVLVAIRIYGWKRVESNWRPMGLSYWVIVLLTGATLGFLSGSIGIGGGIFLIPILLFLGLGNAKQAAASGVLFTWANSVVGLISRMQHHSLDLGPYLPLFAAAVVGGLLGSALGSGKVPAAKMEKILGGIVLLAIVTLLHRLLFQN